MRAIRLLLCVGAVLLVLVGVFLALATREVVIEAERAGHDVTGGVVVTWLVYALLAAIFSLTAWSTARAE